MASKVSSSRELEHICGISSSSFQNSQKGSRSSIQVNKKGIPGVLSGRDPSEMDLVAASAASSHLLILWLCVTY